MAATDDLIALLTAARDAEERLAGFSVVLSETIATLKEANRAYRLGSRAIRRSSPDSIPDALAAIRDFAARVEAAIAAAPAQGTA
jgi:hypothetical protein